MEVKNAFLIKESFLYNKSGEFLWEFTALFLPLRTINYFYKYN